MQTFHNRISVITGGGSGIGRELARQLVQAGCHVAVCDIDQSRLSETLLLCEQNNPHQVMLCGLTCDVAVESDVQRFADYVKQQFASDSIHLLINNAGINGGGSFVNAPRDEWERTFAISWGGVYLITRTFLPLLLNCDAGHLVNISSANALRAVLGGHVPHTAYSTAKFAVRGFTESLIHDFRFNAPHLGVSLVLPGHTGTGIIANSQQILGHAAPQDWSASECQAARQRWTIAGDVAAAALSDEQTRLRGGQEIDDMLESGMPPGVAAQRILAGVRAGEWRIVLGKDTQTLDSLVRDDPNGAYDEAFVERWRRAYQEAEGD